MDKEVAPAVLAFINEKRLAGDKRTPVDIITRMGVFEARDKASDYAWLATGDNVIATIWAEFAHVGAGGRWFYLESLDVLRRLSGGERSALQVQRTKDRVALLKRTFDAGVGFRAVLQTNRVAIADLETDKAAKVSVRVQDEQEWHVASWEADDKFAVLVRGERGWQPDKEELEAARARGGLPPPEPVIAPIFASRDEVQAAAMAYLARHFGGYGYKTDDVAGQQLGYDIEVSDKKGKTLLKLAVKGIGAGVASYQLTDKERASAQQGDPWRLAVVTDPIGVLAQHRLFRGTELASAPGLQG